MTNYALRETAPDGLAAARAIAHKAAQLLTTAARANLAAAPDDSHSNLGWEPSATRFVSQPMPAPGGGARLAGLGLAPLALVWRAETGDGQSQEQSIGLAGASHADALAWLDARLAEDGLEPASSVTPPYELPQEAAAVDAYPSADTPGLASLAAWFDLAHGALSRFKTALEAAEPGLTPGPSPVRCWPHHFDIATYVGLETGDAETARGVGLGLSPGDEHLGQPYFYVNPWPHLAPDGLPAAPAPGVWNTDGFVGLVAAGDAVLAAGADSAAVMDGFLSAAFAQGRAGLGR